MQRRTQADAGPRSFATPARGFAMAAIVLGLVLSLWTAARVAPSALPASGSYASAWTPSETEAEAIFERLDRQRLAAYRARDLTLVDVTFTSDGRLKERVYEEIERLIRDGITPRPLIRTLTLDVEHVAEERIELLQTAIVDARFKDERGRDVTAERRSERQVIRWTIKMERGEWLLHSAVLEAAEVRRG